MDQPERFVDADAVASFLGITRRQVFAAKARAGETPRYSHIRQTKTRVEVSHIGCR